MTVTLCKTKKCVEWCKTVEANMSKEYPYIENVVFLSFERFWVYIVVPKKPVFYARKSWIKEIV